MLREPVANLVDPKAGGMSGHTGRYEKRLSDLKGSMPTRQLIPPS